MSFARDMKYSAWFWRILASSPLTVNCSCPYSCVCCKREYRLSFNPSESLNDCTSDHCTRQIKRSETIQSVASTAQILSKASEVHPPSNTERHRNSNCSFGVNWEQLQSSVARSVLCRSGKSRLPGQSSS